MGFVSLRSLGLEITNKQTRGLGFGQKLSRLGEWGFDQNLNCEMEFQNLGPSRPSCRDSNFFLNIEGLGSSRELTFELKPIISKRSLSASAGLDAFDRVKPMLIMDYSLDFGAS